MHLWLTGTCQACSQWKKWYNSKHYQNHPSQVWHLAFLGLLMQKIVLEKDCVRKLPLPVSGTMSQCIFSSTRVLCKGEGKPYLTVWIYLDYDFRLSFCPSLRYKWIAGAFWKSSFFVPQFSFYNREKTTSPPPHSFPFPHSSFQQNCLISCFYSRNCLSHGIVVVPARISGLCALNTAHTMWGYVTADPKRGWIPVYLPSNTDSNPNSSKYLGFLFNKLDALWSLSLSFGKVNLTDLWSTERKLWTMQQVTVAIMHYS